MYSPPHRYRASLAVSPSVAGLPITPAESGSLALCTVSFLSLPSDLSVTRNALAMRIDFPSDGASLLSHKQTGARPCRAHRTKGPHHHDATRPIHLSNVATATCATSRSTYREQQRQLHANQRCFPTNAKSNSRPAPLPERPEVGSGHKRRPDHVVSPGRVPWSGWGRCTRQANWAARPWHFVRSRW